MKEVVIYFYYNCDRWNYQNAKVKMNYILNKHKSIIKTCECYDDWSSKRGFHFNLLLESSRYKTFLELYKNKGYKKEPDVFMHMSTLNTPLDITKWRAYCVKRANEFNEFDLETMEKNFRLVAVE